MIIDEGFSAVVIRAHEPRKAVGDLAVARASFARWLACVHSGPVGNLWARSAVLIDVATISVATPVGVGCDQTGYFSLFSGGRALPRCGMASEVADAGERLGECFWD